MENDCYALFVYQTTMNLKEKLKKTFLDLIAIDSAYPHEANVIDYVKKRFTRLGITWKEDTFGNMFVSFAGKGEPILLSTHFDIPEPTPEATYKIKGNIIKAAGKNILGADPKSGLAILIELAEKLVKSKAPHTPVEFLITRGEEPGLLGARAADYRLIKSKIGLVLDEDGPITQVVTQAPAFGRLDIEFIGKVVHPREPEKGVNALRVACEALTSLPWGYSRKGVTWNVGMFEAGTARNSVPGIASLKGELRSYDTGLVKSEMKRIERVCSDAAKKYGAKLKFEGELEFEGYNLKRAHSFLFERLEKTFTAMGLKPNYYATFGGSDANIFNKHGIVSVPIGSGYFNAHEYTEYVNLADMVEIFEFLERFSTLE